MCPCWISWSCNKSCWWLWATMQFLEIEPGFSARATLSLNQWTIFPVPRIILMKIIIQPQFLECFCWVQSMDLEKRSSASFPSHVTRQFVLWLLWRFLVWELKGWKCPGFLSATTTLRFSLLSFLHFRLSTVSISSSSSNAISFLSGSVIICGIR